MASFWLGLVASVIGGIMVMFLNLYLLRSKLRLSVYKDFPVGEHSKSIGVVVENYAIPIPIIERSLARRISILYRVSSAEQDLKLTWFFGSWGNQKLADIGYKEKKPMLLATKIKGNDKCSLVGQDYNATLESGKYFLEWTLYESGNPIDEGKLLLSNIGKDLEDFSLAEIEGKPSYNNKTEIINTAKQGANGRKAILKVIMYFLFFCGLTLGAILAFPLVAGAIKIIFAASTVTAPTTSGTLAPSPSEVFAPSSASAMNLSLVATALGAVVLWFATGKKAKKEAEQEPKEIARRGAMTVGLGLLFSAICFALFGLLSPLLPDAVKATDFFSVVIKWTSFFTLIGGGVSLGLSLCIAIFDISFWTVGR